MLYTSIIFNKIQIIDHLYLLAGENERNIIYKMQLQAPLPLHFIAITIASQVRCRIKFNARINTRIANTVCTNAYCTSTSTYINTTCTQLLTLAVWQSMLAPYHRRPLKIWPNKFPSKFAAPHTPVPVPVHSGEYF